MRRQNYRTEYSPWKRVHTLCFFHECIGFNVFSLQSVSWAVSVFVPFTSIHWSCTISGIPAAHYDSGSSCGAAGMNWIWISAVGFPLRKNKHSIMLISPCSWKSSGVSQSVFELTVSQDNKKYILKNTLKFQQNPVTLIHHTNKLRRLLGKITSVNEILILIKVS